MCPKPPRPMLVPTCNSPLIINPVPSPSTTSTESSVRALTSSSGPYHNSAKAAAFLQTFVEYPPSQEKASFSIDQVARDVEAKIKENARKGAGGRALQ